MVRNSSSCRWCWAGCWEGRHGGRKGAPGREDPAGSRTEQKAQQTAQTLDYGSTAESTPLTEESKGIRGLIKVKGDALPWKYPQSASRAQGEGRHYSLMFLYTLLLQISPHAALCRFTYTDSYPLSVIILVSWAHSQKKLVLSERF